MNIRDRVRELRRVPASQLRPNPKNWRTHPKGQADALRGLLAEVGFAGAALARELEDGTLELIDGHLRAETVPDQPIPVLVLDVTEAEADKLLATYDPVGAMATADAAKLDALLRSVQTSSEAVAGLLTDLAAESGVIPADATPGGGGDEFDATPEAAGPTRTGVGEVWVIGGRHRLFVGDCTDPANVARLMGGDVLALAVTDPPYGVSYADKNRFLNAIARGNRIQEPIANDHGDVEDIAEQCWKPAFSTLHGAMRDGAAFYVFAPQGGDQMMMMMMMAAFMPVRHELIWVKNNHVLGRADYAYKHEPILYGWKAGAGHYYGGGFQTSVLEFARPQKNDLHPTMKPVDLVSRLIENSSKPGDPVGDWFLGSGTTLIAAHRLGRTVYGCELEPRYADVILKRAEAEGLACERGA